MEELSQIQVRVLGCLMEKKETTPEQYPLTLNALRNACNQKSSRNPVTAYSEGEVGHTVRELEGMGLVRQEWGSRAHKYSHAFGKAFNLHSKGVALMCTLMLRGPQTLGELKTHSHRLFEFDDLDDVQFALGKLIELDTPLVTALPRQPGQKEGRFVHLLAGEPDVSMTELSSRSQERGSTTRSALEARVLELETQLQALQEQVSELEAELGS